MYLEEHPPLDGIFDTIAKGLTTVSKGVVGITNPILQAKQQYDAAKSLWTGTSAAPSAPSLAPQLSVALSNGANMQELQTLLRSLGIDPGPIDGKYGPKTQAAIARFQAQAGMAQDGKATTAVLNAVRAAAVQSVSTVKPAATPAPATPAPVKTTAAASTGTLTNGAQMRELQTLLQSFGINPGPVDGIYGTKTAAGIREFQAQNGMSQDGKATTALLATVRAIAAVAGGGGTLTPMPAPVYTPPAPPASMPSAGAALPVWVMPAAAAGAGLLLLAVMGKRR
jgi:peptidoglycan hydrolase-like protein with peptidoglycan-binding domain